MRFQNGFPMCFSFVMVAESAEFAFSARMHNVFGILMVAEIAESVFSTRFPHVC